ncbi:SIS domain-containing protein [Polymorphobacter megasporae]|uniref:SIS domain-containing protein n=1 Tax=Glacieibacterium megasporae TaxID=2835787 RepID=UPI001C1DDFF4|nr:SIS domain-containing protein [Polymorphobacter megasporae]UAJ09040.1 SIS domain-containing protein [Polymorphobacter megasporae]
MTVTSAPTLAKTTAMFREAAEAPAWVAAALERNADVVAALAARLRASPPRAVVTIARGSSDNAATYARYLIETRLEILTASMPPSIASVYGARPVMADTLCLVVSQSGHSPDLLAAAAAAEAAGALVVAIVNDEASPLAKQAAVVLPIAAGLETSVAATKSFIGTLAVMAQLVAAWADDTALADAVAMLPERLDAAWASDWSEALPVLEAADHLYVVSRGPALGVAQEAALKFKETCGLHAEAFSSAEVRHGPMTLAGPGFPVFALMPDDAGRAGVAAAVAAFVAQGAPVIVAGGTGGTIALPVVDCHPLLRPIILAQSLYRLVDNLARRRGFDADRPDFLAKVTKTL